jgi:hypothetical protein
MALLLLLDTGLLEFRHTVDPDPLESANDAAGETAGTPDRARARLSTLVAITIALLATFLGDPSVVHACRRRPGVDIV